MLVFGKRAGFHTALSVAARSSYSDRRCECFCAGRLSVLYVDCHWSGVSDV